MNLRLIKLQTYWQLGIANIATVAIYRIVKKIGLFERLLPIRKFPTGPFFLDNPETIEPSSLLRYFSYKDIKVTSPPNWLLNPYNDKKVQCNVLHWSKHPDFDPELGDIKMVWEASRFDWLPKLAWEYKNGNNKALSQIERWLQNWITENPVNQGINWKCGQEASFRCLNLMVALISIDSIFESPTSTVRFFLYHHLTRISLTLRYAMAQDNNHGTSEASALFVVGHYLGLYGNDNQQTKGKKWAKQGRYWLENRVKRLIMKDGSFSQNSVVYHRLLLDTLSITELFRKELNIPTFSKLFYQRACLATLWLHTLTDEVSGDTPNLGCNDGAYLFNLDNTPYRDFHPSIELACNLFIKKSAYKKITHPLTYVFSFEKRKPEILLPSATNSLFMEGGYNRLNRTKDSFSIMRLPIYRFRPSDADALHVDIWHNGINILRDAGTYSYNTEEHYLNYFPGTKSHNTVTFDEHDQMPRLGRFLFGAWLQSNDSMIDCNLSKTSAAYCDKWGACHKRTIRTNNNGWDIIDEISGFKQSAILRWNLSDDNWFFDDSWLMGSSIKIKVESKNKLNTRLTERWESLYYGEKHKRPMLEIECKKEGNIHTHIEIISY